MIMLPTTGNNNNQLLDKMDVSFRYDMIAVLLVTVLCGLMITVMLVLVLPGSKRRFAVPLAIMDLTNYVRGTSTDGTLMVLFVRGGTIQQIIWHKNSTLVAMIQAITIVISR